MSNGISNFFERFFSGVKPCGRDPVFRKVEKYIIFDIIYIYFNMLNYTPSYRHPYFPISDHTAGRAIEKAEGRRPEGGETHIVG